MKKKELQREIDILRNEVSTLTCRVAQLESNEKYRQTKDLYKKLNNQKPIILKTKTFKDCLEDAKRL